MPRIKTKPLLDAREEQVQKEATQNVEVDPHDAIFAQASHQFRRPLPSNDLDLQLMVTDPKWGLLDITPELREQLSNIAYYRDPKTDQVYTKREDLWTILGYYTRDMRLANLGGFEMIYCQYYIDLAGDCLHEGYVRPFIVALSRAVTVLELSQSRGGFLRKRTNTITSEKIDPSQDKKGKIFGNLFGGGGNNNQQQGMQ